MMDLFELGDDYFYLSAIPFVGLLLDLYIPKRVVLYLFVGVSILLIPTFFEYQFSISYVYELMLITAISCVYAYISKRLFDDVIHKKVLNLTLGITLIVILGIGNIFLSAFGKTTTAHVLSSNGYMIEKTVSQGFAGGVLEYYSLSKYSLLPIYCKQLDSHRVEKEEDDCIILFEETKLSFDICNQ
jgi:hypothetical protein